MGSCSNRTSKEERISGCVRKIIETKDTNSLDFQIRTGAKIRGEMGIEKGNAFIKAIRNTA